MNSKKTIFLVYDSIISRNLKSELNALSSYFDIHITIPAVTPQDSGGCMFAIHQVKQSGFRLRKPIGSKFTNIFNAIYYIIAASKIARNTPSNLTVVRSQLLPLMYPILLRNATNTALWFHTALNFTSKGRLFNKISRLSTLLYDHIIIDTEQNVIANNLPKQKCYVCGYGFEPRKFINRKFDSMDLIYVGALNYRNVHETVYGFKRFYREYGPKINMSYNIIGFVDGEDKSLLLSAIEDAGTETPVKYHGWLNDSEVDAMFEKANIGVAFNRVDSSYGAFISFKLHEYLLSGMVVTSTFSELRSAVVNETNGVIHESSPEGFYNGLVHVFKNLDKYDSQKIQDSDWAYSLEYNIQNIQVPMYLKLIEKRK
jgi:hypothetical protein